VDLLEVDAPVEPLQLTRELRPPLVDGARPDLRGDERRLAPVSQRRPEHRLGAPVHRRGVEEPAAGVQRGGDDGVRHRLLIGADVEDRPGAEPDDGDLDAGAEGAGLHAECLPGPVLSRAVGPVAASQRALGAGVALVLVTGRGDGRRHSPRIRSRTDAGWERNG
jgi:hypothetical protein